MTIYLNEEPLLLQGESTLYDTLKEAGLHTKKGIAVAVNNVVTPKPNWPQCFLKEADQITVITATQGG